MNRLMDTSRSTVRNQFNEGVNTYEEKPREQWLYDFPAQVALASTQVWWSTEVNIAFARLEEGHENALKEYNKKQVLYGDTSHLWICGHVRKRWLLYKKKGL